MANASRRDQVFISYSHKDKKLFDQLQTFLKPLVRDKKISVWDDDQIKSGDAWREGIKVAIASAKVAVLLVSQDFIVSDFIAEHELPPILEAAQTEGLRILWIAARHSGYEETEIARYQAVNDPARPLARISGANRERELVRICKEIMEAALETTAEHGRDSTHATQGEKASTQPNHTQATSKLPSSSCQLDEHDRRLFAMFNTAFPSGGSAARFLHDHDVGADFPPETIYPLQDFLNRWGDAEHEFNNPEMEKKRRDLWNVLGIFLSELEQNTFFNHRGRLSMGLEDMGNSPETLKTLRRLNDLGTKAYTAHQDLIREGRKHGASISPE
jgi:hypothetical protein